MRFTFCPLFSGSSGNALFIGAGDTRILIDAGMTGKAIEGALQQIGVLPETLNGIAVTLNIAVICVFLIFSGDCEFCLADFKSFFNCLMSAFREG